MSAEHYRQDVIDAINLDPFTRGSISQTEDPSLRAALYKDAQVNAVLDLIGLIEGYSEMPKDPDLEESKAWRRGRTRR